MQLTKKKKRNIWTDNVSPYGTYEGDAGNSDQWKKSFEFMKLSREQALNILLGIIETPYEILGISKDATEEMIKKAMRKLALMHHPDKGGDTEKFRKIMAAYTILTT